jgi:excisionase family DNA binding protein
MSPRLPVSLVAERVNVPVRTLYHYIKTGALPAAKVKGRYYVRVDCAHAVAEATTRHKRQPVAEAAA